MGLTRRDVLASAAVLSLAGLSACQSVVMGSTMNQPESTTGNDLVAAQGQPLKTEKVPPTKQKRILHVVTNVGHYNDASHLTGLWLSELTHAYDTFAAAGHEQHIVSPQGGVIPIEPRSLKWPYFDESARKGQADPTLSAMLGKTSRPEEVDAKDYDVIYFTGGHGVMWDFPDNSALQAITRDIYERGGIVSSVCHGYCGLLNTKLSDGSLLVAGKRLTGFSWFEEVLAGVAKEVPYNVQEEMRQRGALYERAFLPYTSNVVVDGRLVTGQNPNSAKATAQAVLGLI